MKSIKPGRGPSMMGGIGAVGVMIFGIIWIFAAMSIGAPGFFCLFGVVFVAIAGVQAYYNFHNATSENRYSAFDITDEEEEPDPLNERFAERMEEAEQKQISSSGGFCPYCGTPAEKDHRFCRNCGKKIMD
ncbi:MAG: zinc ribbon domain-containing protein [Anaerotignum sp.]|nr:zinc ribbon domain-containing protein [Anaerotignum sp.]